MYCPQCQREMKQVGRFWVCGECGRTLHIAAAPTHLPTLLRDHPLADLIASLPTVIALPSAELFGEPNPYIALHRLVDAAEIATRFFTAILLSDLLRLGQFPEAVRIALAEKVERPTFGAWKDLLQMACENLPKKKGHTQCFVTELPEFLQRHWLPALGTGEKRPEKAFIALRNLIAHSGRLSNEHAQRLLDAHKSGFEDLVRQLSFLADYALIACSKEGTLLWLRGLPDESGSFPTFDQPLSFSPESERIYLVRNGEGLNLFPLHAFAEIMQWREERYEFESLGETTPQVYFRFSERGDRGYLEFVAFGKKAPLSQMSGSAYEAFQQIFKVEERRIQGQRKGRAQEQFGDIVSELTEVFVGRDEAVKAIKERIKQARRGILWVTGQPGVGKSAVMAKLMSDYRGQQHYIVIPYFFRSGHAGCSVREFVSAAMTILQEALNETSLPARTLPEQQGQLAEAAQKAAQSKKVLFLVDGLDEIYRQEREVAMFLPLVHGENIVWVCAGRDETDLKEELKRRDAVWVFEDGLPTLSEDAVRAMLVEHLGPLKYKLFQRDDEQGYNRFVEVVTRKAQGLPLYVRMVVEDLKAGRWTVNDEDRLPEGLTAYFEALLERMRLSDEGTVLTPLICLLAWSKEPVTEAALDWLLQTHHLRSSPRWGKLFQRVIEYGHQMLVRRLTKEGESGWTIYHDEFRRHLLKTKTVEENREWAQRRWLEAGERWRALEQEEPSLHRYFLRHYAEHLKEAGTYEALFELARDEEFARAQLEKLREEPTLPLRTKALALEGAIKREDGALIAEFLLSHARMVDELKRKESPLQALRETGKLNRALELCNLYITESKVLWHLLLAWELKDSGRTGEAMEILQKLNDQELLSLSGWEADAAALILPRLTNILSEAPSQTKSMGEQAEVLRIVDEALAKVGEGETEKEVLERALQIAKGIKYPRARAWAMGKIALALMEASEKDKAKEVFEQSLQSAEEDQYSMAQAWALSKIALALIEIGEKEKANEIFDQSLQIAREIGDAGWQSPALREIASALSEVGEKEKAKKIFEQALEAAGRIDDAWVQARTLSKIALALNEAGEKEKSKEVLKQVLQVTRKIDDEGMRARALRGIAEALEVERAWRASEKTNDPGVQAWEQTWALQRIGEVLAKVGEKENAKKVFESALQVAENIEDKFWRAEALRGIALSLAEAGEFERALKVAGSIKDVFWQAWTLCEIAKTLAKAGQGERSVEIAVRIQTDQNWYLSAIGATLMKACDKENFKQLLPQCAYYSEAAYQMCGLLAKLYPQQAAEIAEVARKTRQGGA